MPQSGVGPNVNASAIAERCEKMWGSTFHYADDGRIDFPKRIVTYPEKVRYLMALSKRIGVEGHDAPADVWREVPAEEQHVPIDQMVYIGDGASDLPAFNLMENHGGLSIGMTKGGDTARWTREHEVHADRRVQNLAEADFSPESELLASLRFAVESVAKLVALRKLGEAE